MHLSDLCSYTSLALPFLCPPRLPSKQQCDRTAWDSIKIHKDDIQKPFVHASSWWSVKEEKDTSVKHRRELSPMQNQASISDWRSKNFLYPQAKRDNTSFTYASEKFGQLSVPDPYHWLEQRASDSKEVRIFYDEQAAFTQRYVDRCEDLHGIRHMLDMVNEYPRYSVLQSVKRDNKTTYYYALNTGLQAQSVWYAATREQILAAEAVDYVSPPGEKYFDVNLMSPDGTTTITDLSFSPSGSVAAYSVSPAGGDLRTIYFRNASITFLERPADASIAAEGGADRLPDVLRNIKFSEMHWTKDGSGVFYQRYSGPTNLHPEVLFHRLGTLQEEDLLVVAHDPDRLDSVYIPAISGDGKWLSISNLEGAGLTSRIYLAPLDQPISSSMKWLSVAPSFDYALVSLGSDGDVFFFKSNKDAPNWKVVRTTIDPAKAKKVPHVTALRDESVFEDVFAEDQEKMLDLVYDVNKNTTLLVYINDVKHEIYQFNRKTGKQVCRILPDFVGTVKSITAGLAPNEVFISVESLTIPEIVYKAMWKEDGSNPSAPPKITQHRSTKVKGLNLDALTSEQIFVTSNDGTKVPVSLLRGQNTPMDGSAPALVHYYGGFGSSLMPEFNPFYLSWVASYGGVLVWVNARGGSEYGERWREAGIVMNKLNTFDDVISACQHVVDQKIAAKGNLVLNGMSNGGLVSMAVANRAPEGLIGAVLAEVPITDMLRYELYTAGALWPSEYGDPRDPKQFNYLYGWSPLHNVNATKVYPFMLLTTADHDDRVLPFHSFKMVAELQSKLQNNSQPFLIRVTKKAGHGYFNSFIKALEVSSIQFCLAAQSLSLSRQTFP